MSDKQRTDIQTLIVAVNKYKDEYMQPVDLDRNRYEFRLGFYRTLKAPYKFRCGILFVLKNKISGKVLQEDFVWVYKNRAEKAYRGLSNIDYTESTANNRIMYLQGVLTALDRGVLLKAMMMDESSKREKPDKELRECNAVKDKIKIENKGGY